jgi:lysophospholipase L1-like esterase
MLTSSSRRRVLAILLTVGGMLSPAAGVWGQEKKQDTKVGSERWEADIKKFEAADRENPPPQGAILFTGASSIRLWETLARDFPEHKVINRGFGGSQMSDAVAFADRIVIPYKPKMIIIQAGGNDINAGKSPEQVLADFKVFVEKVHAALPYVKIAYMSINASPRRWEQVEQQTKANKLVKDYVAANKNLDYIDIWDSVLGPDGKPRDDMFVADRLHPSPEGYKARTAIVRKHLP